MKKQLSLKAIYRSKRVKSVLKKKEIGGNGEVSQSSRRVNILNITTILELCQKIRGSEDGVRPAEVGRGGLVLW